ncbi:MAG: hypothetical protein A2Z16_01435 [Chloroflexi bacterium RBG_16_54_18]|nr:MAG: hypothetical protein A2Z16_01435 [Chloroflexi bacterium RBG_16_54_18]
MKILDIAFKDLLRSTRSAISLVFMFGIPILVTGLFYFMFGRIASQETFNLPRTRVAIVNLDLAAPRLQANRGSIPGGIRASTVSELVVEVLQNEDMRELIDPVLFPEAAAAKKAVDVGEVQVAIIIPAGFSSQFSDPYGEASIEFYQDPTLTIGPEVIQTILHQFMDGLSGVRIAIKVTLDQAGVTSFAVIQQVIERYLEGLEGRSEDLAETFLETRAPGKKPETANPITQIIGPLMAGMMVFYSFYTGVATAESILREEEERTLPRLFTTPTSQTTILSGKFLAVLFTVLVQIIVLVLFGRFIFGIQWGNSWSLALIIAGTVLAASTFGLFVNSFLKNTKQGGVVFGGVLTFTGMLGMIRIFGVNSPSATLLGDTVSLLVPQGWAVRGFVYVFDAKPVSDALITFLVLAAWSLAFFSIGVWRFGKRYA